MDTVQSGNSSNDDRHVRYEFRLLITLSLRHLFYFHVFEQNNNILDRNNNSTIDFDEFAALWNYINEWQKCFRAFDRDNSGSIDQMELKQALTSFGNYYTLFDTKNFSYYFLT